MEPIADTLKGFAKSGQDFVTSLIHRRKSSSRRNPIEILKRLQREAFSDLMKLRDRQDKVERVLSFYRTSKGSSFGEADTHLRGEVDALGALLMDDGIDQENLDALRRGGIRTGIESRFTFETNLREKDSFVAEFTTCQKAESCPSNAYGNQLSLSKVSYIANVSDWFSVVAIPVGGRCGDLQMGRICSTQEKGLTGFSSFCPPLLRQHNGSAIGLTVRKSNIAGSLAQFISRLSSHPGSVGIGQCLGTFGQIVCQLSRGTTLSLSGLHQLPKPSSENTNFGVLTIPKRRRAPVMYAEAPSSTAGECMPTGLVALMLESELDESTRIGGWVEVENSNLRHVRWAISVTDFPRNELGWGLSFGGVVHGSARWDHFQVEACLKYDLGERFRLQPGFAYVVSGDARVPALMLRSSWLL